MDSFAFIIHPIDPKKDVARKYPLLGKTLPTGVIDFLSLFWPPVYISQITGIRSEATGKEIEGWFVVCPLTPARMMQLPPPIVYKKVIQTGNLARKLGADIVGLGAFTSVVGDAGITVSKGLTVPVTTGDSYTVAIAVDAACEAAGIMGIELESATSAVVGATGAIGRVCSILMARRTRRVVLIGRRDYALEEVAAEVREDAENMAEVETGTRMEDLLRADVVITVTSATGTIIGPHHLKRGAVVCDVSRPRDVSRQVVEERKDVLVIEGGMVEVPGEVDFHFDFGFPPGLAYACMAETMVLALEGRFEPFTLGKRIELEKVVEISSLASKHGFRLNGFRSFERPVTDEYVREVKRNAGLA